MYGPKGATLRHHAVAGADLNAFSNAMNNADPAQQTSTVDAPPDAAGPKQVLTRTAGAEVYLVVRYTMGRPALTAQRASHRGAVSADRDVIDLAAAAVDVVAAPASRQMQNASTLRARALPEKRRIRGESPAARSSRSTLQSGQKLGGVSACELARRRQRRDVHDVRDPASPCAHTRRAPTQIEDVLSVARSESNHAENLRSRAFIALGRARRK